MKLQRMRRPYVAEVHFSFILPIPYILQVQRHAYMDVDMYMDAFHATAGAALGEPPTSWAMCRISIAVATKTRCGSQGVRAIRRERGCMAQPRAKRAANGELELRGTM